MIHQNNRGETEASSGLLQWVNEHVDHHMDLVDDDGEEGNFDVHKRKVKPRIWRRIEHKPIGGSPRESQHILLPIIAASMLGDVNWKVLNPRSGVFMVWSNPPHDRGIVAKVHPHYGPNSTLKYGAQRKLMGDDWVQFWLCAETPMVTI
jgi:hypothetical protein